MPSDGSKYREAVTERLDDELSHWQSRLDHLRVCLLEEPAGQHLQDDLVRLETDLLQAKLQWQRMKDAAAPDWDSERNALTAALGRIQRALYQLQVRVPP